MACGRLVVFFGYSGFLREENWSQWYNWNIAKSGVKHHNPPLNVLTYKVAQNRSLKSITTPVFKLSINIKWYCLPYSTYSNLAIKSENTIFRFKIISFRRIFFKTHDVLFYACTKLGKLDALMCDRYRCCLLLRFGYCILKLNEIRLEYPILRNVSNMSEESAESLLHVYFQSKTLFAFRMCKFVSIVWICLNIGCLAHHAP